jgi:hypothetical protein
VEERVMTRHPDPGKVGVNIRKDKYDRIRDAILKVLRMEGEVLFKDLPAEVELQLKGTFEGSIGWYVTTVKLDLEARGVIERIPGSTPQKSRLRSGGG